MMQIQNISHFQQQYNLSNLMQLQQVSDKLSINVNDQIKESIASVSQSGRFQQKLIIFFLFISFFTCFQYYSSEFYYMNPVFQCENIDQNVSEDQACDMLDFCRLTNTQTIVAELNLYCGQKKSQRIFIQIASGMGNWIGLIFAGIVSDRKGRKFSFCIGFSFLNIVCLFQFIGVHYKNTSLLLISELIAGFCNRIIYLNFLVILTRFLSKNSYEAGTLGWFIVGNGIGMVAIAALNQQFKNWRVLFYIQSFGVLFCSVASFFVLLEDPIYLFDVGKLEESKAVIQKIGEQNGVQFNENHQNRKKIDFIFEMQMEQIEQNGQSNKFKFNMCEIIRCDIFTRIALIGVIGFFYNMTVKSIQLSIQNLKNSYNFNLFILGISNIFGFLTAIYIIRAQKTRRRGFICTSIIYGVLAFLFVFPFCYQNGNLQTIILFFLRLFLCWICNFYTRMKVDSFPEKYQLSCISILQFLSNSGGIIGPILIQQSADRHVSPIFAINLLRMTVGTLPLLFLSQHRIILDSSQQQASFSEKKNNDNPIQIAS